MARPTDPDQLAVGLRELAHDLRGVFGPDDPGDVEAIVRDVGATLDHLAQLLDAEADRPPVERMRDLAAQHVGRIPPTVRAHG